MSTNIHTSTTLCPISSMALATFCSHG
jgi:hypothetical protein